MKIGSAGLGKMPVLVGPLEEVIHTATVGEGCILQVPVSADDIQRCQATFEKNLYPSVKYRQANKNEHYFHDAESSIYKLILYMKIGPHG